MKLIYICRARRRHFLCLLLLLGLGCSQPTSSTSVTPATPVEQTALTAAAEAPDKSPPVATPMRLTDDAFRFAAYEGKLEVVRQAIEAGNNVNAADAERQLTPLHMAAFNGHAEVIQLLLAHGGQLDAKDVEGKTPLLHACTGPFVEAVELLIEAGADINTTESTEAFTPLMMAAGLGQTAVVKVLLAHHAEKDLLDDDGDSALKHAQNSRHAEIVELLKD